jgi:hypothetical protein
MTGLVLNLAAAALITQEEWVLGGRGVHRRLDHGHAGRPLRALVARARRSGRSSTRRSTASRRASCWRGRALFRDAERRDRGRATVGVVLFSLMVSYTRARAEALGVENKGGIATRRYV